MPHKLSPVPHLTGAHPKELLLRWDRVRLMPPNCGYKFVMACVGKVVLSNRRSKVDYTHFSFDTNLSLQLSNTSRSHLSP